MHIVRCDHSLRDAWDAFVDAHAGGSFYHRYDWRTVNATCFGHQSAYLAATEKDAIVGILPVVLLKSRLFGNIACSLPFVNYGGLVALNERAEAELLREARAVADEWQVDYVEIRSRCQGGAGLPQSEHKVILTIDLDADPEKLWAAFKTGHRQDIRRAAKNDYEVRIGGAELLEDFYAILSESWRDLGTPFYRARYFEEIVRTFPTRIRLAVAYAAGQPAAAAFDGLSTSIVEGMWLGARAQHRARGVNYVLYWELVKHACQQGFQQFHLGRSTADSGGETFKKKWNAHVTQLYWQYMLRTSSDLPQLHVNNPRYRLAINAWRRLPVPVTRLIGPMIAKNIP